MRSPWGALLLLGLSQVVSCSTDYEETSGDALNGVQVDFTASSTTVMSTTENSDPCDDVLCLNGGLCVVQFKTNITSISCNCTFGFVGKFCQFRNPCSLKSPLSRRCYNGGTCKVKFPKSNSSDVYFGKPTYECACKTGHIGQNCASFDYCAIAPCQKGTACRNLDNGYTCDCPSGYRGTDCKLDVDECAMEEPCQNDGVCVNTMGSYRCICPRGFKGPKCEDVHIPCSTNPCKNGGLCCPGQNSTHTEHCDCPSGFAGRFCEENLDDCPGHSCQNGGKCVDKVDAYACECPVGYDGQFCTDDIDECSEQPSVCQNGGRCLNRVGNFSCLCTQDFEGSTCGEAKDHCTPNPCTRLQGVCVPSSTMPGYTCVCASRYTGNHCQHVNPCYGSPCYSWERCKEVPTNGGLGSPGRICI